MRKIGKQPTPIQEYYDFLISVHDRECPDKSPDTPYDKPGVYIDDDGIHIS